MKKKMLLMMLALTVSVALIVGATMAWFTAEDKTKDAEFTAGKVSISADGATPLGDRSLDNVNPGDCYTLEYEITNDGTKVINLRAILNINWGNNLSLDNIYVIPHPSTNWVLYQLEGKKGPENPIYAYYLGDESKDVAPEETVKLRLVVYFDGEETNNDYMEKKFYVKGKVEAVQASHNAASNEWGDGWDTVTGDGYSFDYEGWYLNELDPEDIDCYDADLDDPEEPDPSQTPEPEIADVNSFSCNYKIISNNRKSISCFIFNAMDAENNTVSGEKEITVTGIQKGNHNTMEKTTTVELDEEGNTEAFYINFDNPLSWDPGIKIIIDGVEVTAVYRMP
jgi:predicted ribosomally synthesized peptide with SipW-like signal peptide